MKKLSLFIITISLISNVTMAQLKMSSIGNFAIANNPNPVNYSKLWVDFSSTSHDGYRNYGVHIFNTPISTSFVPHGLWVSCYYPNPDNAQSLGIFAKAGNATSGYNYAVGGQLVGSRNGTGIFGAMYGRGFVGTGGNYAGFFNGDVKITDVLTVNTTTYQSDVRLKKNVSLLAKNNFESIYQLEAVEYNFKTRQELKQSGIIVNDTATFVEIENKYIDKIHYGYIAQDVQKIYPELVYESDDGLLGIDYIGFIPLMIEVLKQQNNTINELKQEINSCCQTEIINKSLLNNQLPGQNAPTEIYSTKAKLYQNTPNPFAEETKIKCYIPEETGIAELFIYNMQGTQIKKIPVNDKKDVVITIQGNELIAGMYLYSLIVDGKEVDTKKMILTE